MTQNDLTCQVPARRRRTHLSKVLLFLSLALPGLIAASPEVALAICGGSIGDFAWNDLNRNGRQDPGEPGLAGVRVALKNLDGVVLAQQTTGANGFYLFGGRCAGTYVVTSTPPAGFTLTTPRAPGTTGANDSNRTPARVALLRSSSTNRKIDFGFVSSCAARIGNLVWHDLDGDGVRDSGDPGLPGVSVALTDQATGARRTTTTDANGLYAFEGLCAGTYTVAPDPASVPAGLRSTIPLATTPDLDSNPTPAAVSLAGNTSVEDTIDFGFKACGGVIGDFVWYDANQDGIQGGGEPGLNGVQVMVRDSGGTVVGATMTGARPGTGEPGYYQLTGLCAGNHTVEVVPGDRFSSVPSHGPQGTPATDSNPSPAAVTLATDTSSDQTIDFGLYYRTFCTVTEGPEDNQDVIVRPSVLRMQYTGSSCAATNHFQEPNKVNCTGDPVSAPRVRIVATDRENFTQASTKVWTDRFVSLGGEFDIDAPSAGATRLGEETFVHVFAADGQTLLQSVSFLTSCGQPLVAGDQYGSLRLVDFTGTP